MIGPEIRTTLSRSIRCNIKHNLIHRIFPRFKKFACFLFESSLADDDDNLGSDWSLR